MNWRFDYVLKMDIFQASTFLDFRYKMLQYLPKAKRADFKRQAKLYIIELYNQHFKPAITIIPLKNRISREITNTNKR